MASIHHKFHPFLHHGGPRGLCLRLVLAILQGPTSLSKYVRLWTSMRSHSHQFCLRRGSLLSCVLHSRPSGVGHYALQVMYPFRCLDEVVKLIRIARKPCKKGTMSSHLFTSCSAYLFSTQVEFGSEVCRITCIHDHSWPEGCRF